MIRRAEERNTFTIISGKTVNDTELSFEALGLLVRMLSMSDEWEFSIDGLAYQFKASRKTVARLVKELRSKGYIAMTFYKNKGGQFTSCAWEVNEEVRMSKNGTTEKGNTVNRMPQNGNTVHGTTANGTLTNINITNNNITNIKGTNNKDDFEKLLSPLSPELKETFLEFIKMRKTIKAPMTAKALDLAIKKAEKLGGGDPDKMKAVIEQSIMNSWKGLFALKEPDRAKPAPIKTGNEFLDLLNEWGETE